MSAHRKIDLQSRADLQYLIANSATAARKRIDTHFPPPAEDAVTDDPLRKRVEVLVQEFLERTFTSAKGNVLINGLEGSEVEEGMGQETEPFDHALARKVQAVSSQIENLTLQLATLRREVPAQTAGRYTRNIEEEQRRWEEVMRRAQEVDGHVGEDVHVKVDLDVNELRKAWDEGTSKLVVVKDGVGSARARVERARGAVGYLAEA